MKKISKFIFMLFLSIIFIPVSTLVADAKTNDEQQIKTVIEQYFNLKYQSYVNSEFKDFSHLVDTSREGNRYEIESLKYEIDAMEYTGLNFEEYPLYINYEKVEINNNNAIAKITVDGDDVLLHIYPAFSILGSHNMEMLKKDGKWIIKEDLYTDVIGPKENKKVSDIEELRKTMDKRLGESKKNALQNILMKMKLLIKKMIWMLSLFLQ